MVNVHEYRYISVLQMTDPQWLLFTQAQAPILLSDMETRT